MHDAASLRLLTLLCAQRLRETIRGWAADPTIRDVSLLLETRRAIEIEMVRSMRARLPACAAGADMVRNMRARLHACAARDHAVLHKHD